MGEQHISIWEILVLQLFLGSLIYIVGSIVMFFILQKVVILKQKIFLYLLLLFCVSVLLSLAIWKFVEASAKLRLK